MEAQSTTHEAVSPKGKCECDQTSIQRPIYRKCKGQECVKGPFGGAISKTQTMRTLQNQLFNFFNKQTAKGDAETEEDPCII